MRILLLLLFSSLNLIYAGCGDCEEMEREIEMEKEIDRKYHECRSCKKPDTSDTICPNFGYECSENGITTNILRATDRCLCLEARCANAKLYIKMTELSEPVRMSKIRCNSTKWMVNGAIIHSAACAKDCNPGACKTFHSKASSDFTPLKVIRATLQTTEKCATADKCPNGFASLKHDGILLSELEGVDKLTCTGDGKWKYVEGLETKEQKHVMCNASPCGPYKCPAALIQVPPERGLIPLIVTGHADKCATATCPGGYMKLDSKTGANLGPIDTEALTCTNAGVWEDDSKATHDAVMCEQPPCPGACSAASPYVPTRPPMQFDSPIRTGCEYSCPDNMGLFFIDWTLQNTLRSLRVPTTCVDQGYEISSDRSVNRVGCYACHKADGRWEATIGEPKAKLDHCVLMCDNSFKLQYTAPTDGSLISVDQLFSYFPNLHNIEQRAFYDADHGVHVDLSSTEIRCIKK